MGNRIISISRQFGSGGHEVAVKTADLLGISEKKLLALMLAAEDMAADVGSILYGEEAVADGLIARVGTLADAYEELYTLIAASRAATKSRRKRAAQEK